MRSCAARLNVNKVLKILSLLATILAGVSLEADTAKPVVELNLTPTEQAWIKAHPVIRAGHDASYAPYAFQDAAGRITGLDPDFLELIARRTGLKFEHQTRPEWPQMVEALKAHEVDVLGSMGSSPEREAFMTLSDVYTLAPNVIITRSDSPYFFDVRELAGRKISRPRGYAGLDNDINEQAPGHIRVEYRTTLECIEAVERGEVFATIADVANAAYLIKQQRLVSLRLSSVIASSSEIYFGVRKDWPELVSIMNKAITSFTPEERLVINNRWIALDYQQDRWWVRAFQVAAGIAVATVLIFFLLFLHNRRLASELEQRRRIQHELEATHRQLASVSEEKSELLRMVAHDLRSPLTGILLGTDLLRASRGTDEKLLLDMCGQIQSTTRQMMRLASDLVDVHALEEGRRTYQWVTLDACAVLLEVVAAHSEMAARKKIRLTSETEEPAMLLETDAGALRQVMDNLISNALKFSPVNSTVLVELRRMEQGLRLLVCDEGRGISTAERDRLFQKYVQGSASPTGGEKSTGLGLWIVKRLVLGLRGEVRCESDPGSGARFIVDLPAHAHQAKPARPA